MGESPISVRAAFESARFLKPTGKGVLPAGVAAGVSRDSAEANRLANLLRIVFSFPAMLGALLVGAAFIAGRMFAVDPDLWWHVKNGQNILATHHWPTSDPYSFTVASTPWLSYEWLGDVPLGAVARFGGLQGLDALLILLSGAVMLALYAYTTLRSGNSKAGFVAAVSLYALATPFFSLRPQMLGYLFIILTLIALERFRQGKPWALWFLPPLFLVWINTHGSWLIGLGIIFLSLVSGLAEFRVGGLEAKRWSPANRRRLSFAFLLCLAVLPITPYGTQMAVYPFEVAFKLPMGVANVSEWQPMPFNLPGGKLFLGLLLAFLVLQVIFRFTWRLEELTLFLFGTMMACLHLRFLLLFVPFFAPLFATMLARWVPPYDRIKDRYVLNAILMAVVVVLVVRYFPTQMELHKGISEKFPVGAVEYMSRHAVPGPTFNNYNFGGYMIWSGYKVFIDGRSDPYERGGALSDYLFISHMKPGTASVLNAYGIQSCLIERDEPLATMLAVLPGWQKVYADNLSVLFVKRNGAASSDAQPGQPAPGQKK